MSPNRIHTVGQPINHLPNEMNFNMIDVLHAQRKTSTMANSFLFVFISSQRLVDRIICPFFLRTYLYSYGIERCTPNRFRLIFFLFNIYKYYVWCFWVAKCFRGVFIYLTVCDRVTLSKKSSSSSLKKHSIWCDWRMKFNLNSANFMEWSKCFFI